MLRIIVRNFQQIKISKSLLCRWTSAKHLCTSPLIKTSYPAQYSATGFDNYDKEYANFKLDVPEHFNFAEDVLEKWAEKEAVCNLSITKKVNIHHIIICLK